MAYIYQLLWSKFVSNILPKYVSWLIQKYEV